MYADDTSVQTSANMLRELEKKTEENIALLMGGINKNRLALNK